MRIKLPNTIIQTQKSPLNTKLTTNDKHAKDKIKSFVDKKRHAITRHTSHASRKHCVSTTTQDRQTNITIRPSSYTVVNIRGTMKTIYDRNITRNASHFKPIKLEPGIVVTDTDNDDVNTLRQSQIHRRFERTREMSELTLRQPPATHRMLILRRHAATHLLLRRPLNPGEHRERGRLPHTSTSHVYELAK